MSETITIYLDDKPVEVPKGATLVDAAKMHGVDIPVFCYHPKLEPVGMCRMCLVELGFEQHDRQTGEAVLDEDGKPLVRWMPTLQTACTTRTSAGMHVRTLSEMVSRGRRDIIEFLLNNHPLECPICDKGGECSLQNLATRYGPAVSRFVPEDKRHLAKHVPLGELIYLDRERCILCDRCVRYCEEIVDDPVLALHERGSSLQIITASEPGFDSKFSGNTTDICPVGALTTADFRFGARPWELTNIPSICPHCAVGCNITLCTRLDRDAGGGAIIKRVMPRQNEQVNEIWICDKGRFGHHFTTAPDRVTSPLVRREGGLIEATWEEALEAIVARLDQAKGAVGALAGPTLSNEDLWALRRLLAGRGSQKLGVWPANMTGGELIAEVGLASGSNFSDMGKGTCIMVIASDLEEEAPIWWHRVKTAADRGASLVVINGRPTKLDRYTSHSIRYQYGGEVEALGSLLRAVVDSGWTDAAFISARVDGFEQLGAALPEMTGAHKDAASALAKAENLVIIVGGEGLSRARHGALMQAAANLLIVTGHVGRPNNGLVAVWPGANTQGALDMGFRAESTDAILGRTGEVKALLIAGADPVGESPAAAEALETLRREGGFIILTELFATPTVALADVVLPRMSFAEREGTFTNGERRVQRFYRALEPTGQARPDWMIFQQIGERLGQGRAKPAAAAVMAEINAELPLYAGMDYPSLARVEPQFPQVGDDDLYYGGTAGKNTGGLGVQWSSAGEDVSHRLPVKAAEAPPPPAPADDQLMVVPVRLLYDRGIVFYKSELMHGRVPEPYVALSAGDADRLGLSDGARARVTVDGRTVEVEARLGDATVDGVALVPVELGTGPLPRAASAGTVSTLEG
jgi:NADH-quinone oxidoreductase subunit G